MNISYIKYKSLNYKIIVLFTLILFSITSFSQGISSDSRLAQQYYREKQYEKAKPLFEKLYQQTNSKYYFSYYIQCMIELKQFEEAEKFLKKKIKKDKNNLNYYVELGGVYKAQGLEDKANQQYETAIKKMPAQRQAISSLANAFIYKREYSWAEKTYLQARKMMNNSYPYNYELANVYLYMREYDKMINEYLNLLEINRSYLNSVQNRLQSIVYMSKDKDLNLILKRNLIAKIQENPKNDIFSELLIWLYIQEKDFQNAFIQSKALDKRNKEYGERLLQLGQTASDNKDYKTAVDCYNYIISLGQDKPYYKIAKTELADAMFKMIQEHTPDKEQIEKLDKLFTETITELNNPKYSFNTSINLAKLRAFYENNYDSGIKLIEDAIKTPGIKKQKIDKAKLVLGDIYLLKEESWNATIYYAQVEQDNKTNPLGHLARFKKAKLAYYTGDFAWAQAQLSVLKAATSKLISNDAFKLSMLISENLENDTATDALKMYAKADFFVYAKNDSAASVLLDSLIKKYKTNKIIDDALFMLAGIEYRKENYEKSLEYYNQVSENYAFDILADDALYKQAEIYLYKLKDKQKAMEFYKKIIIEHPDSYYATEAREKFRELRGDFDDKKPVE